MKKAPGRGRGGGGGGGGRGGPKILGVADECFGRIGINVAMEI